LRSVISENQDDSNDPVIPVTYIREQT
jgi:hypothetical protein